MPEDDAPSRIEPSFLARVLAPYTPSGTDYLKAARVLSSCTTASDGGTAVMTTEGLFSIPNSCYIQSTGHFNAVEFLICFNQLAYTTFGHLVATGQLANLPETHASANTRERLKDITEDAFFDDQLSSMLILRADQRFRKIIDAKEFIATLTMKTMVFRRDTLFVDSTCRFSDLQGGDAEGDVMLAYVRRWA
jgi:hypothetical protein